jgi:hypothetical protein
LTAYTLDVLAQTTLLLLHSGGQDFQSACDRRAPEAMPPLTSSNNGGGGLEEWKLEQRDIGRIQKLHGCRPDASFEECLRHPVSWVEAERAGAGQH